MTPQQEAWAREHSHPGQPCRCCKGPTIPRRTRHGWCDACYLRWYRAGRPEDGPPPRVRQQGNPGFLDQARAAIRENYEARLEWFADLLAEDPDMPPKAIARRMGIGQSTARTYQRLLRQRAQEAGRG